MRKEFFIAALVFAVLGATAYANGEKPYTGLEKRQIKALSVERIAGLRAGDGLSYALAAELNRYPGPRHVLDLADILALDETQRQAIEAIFADMNAEARVFGAALIEAEARLDAAFAGGTATPDAVERLTEDIAAIEGRLRAVHLNAHLATDPFLSVHQRKLYAQARGYDDTGAAGDHRGHTDRH